MINWWIKHKVFHESCILEVFLLSFVYELPLLLNTREFCISDGNKEKRGTEE
jgi:hypothetical protein